MLVNEDGRTAGSIGKLLNEKTLQLANEIFLQRESRRASVDGETELFLEFISPPPTLIAVGGVHVTIALLSMARILGFRTVVIDPRKLWGNEERFPHIDRLIQVWPEVAFQQMDITHSTAVAVLTHDPKLDDAALKFALKSPAFYLGALGSKRTNADRHGRLLKEGFTERDLSRLHAPIGLDINAKTPEEIALAIMSEVVGAYRKQERLPAAEKADLDSLHM
jgi:xanthine dehydrogenase accessory factor